MSNETFTTPLPGLQYMDGKLYDFKKTRIIVYGFDKYGPRAWRKSASEPTWESTSYPGTMGEMPVRRLNLPPDTGFHKNYRVEIEMAFIRDNVPPEIVRVMGKAHRDVYQLCALAMRVDGGLELMESNPGVGYLVALNNVFMKSVSRPWRRSRRLVSPKRTKILREAGFVGRPAEVKILGRLLPDALNRKTLFKLRKLLREPSRYEIKHLCHLPHISRLHIDILSTRRLAPQVTVPLLTQLGDLQHASDGWMLWNLHSLCARHNRSIPGPIASVEQLARAHRLLGGLNFNDHAPVEFHEYSPAPIPDLHRLDIQIEHIRNTGELELWAASQDNCILTYNDALAAGDFHMYKIHSGEEQATLTIKELQYGAFQLDQLQGRKNAAVSPNTIEVVMNWVGR